MAQISEEWRIVSIFLSSPVVQSLAEQIQSELEALFPFLLVPEVE